jgi:hypothetical protein
MLGEQRNEGAEPGDESAEPPSTPATARGGNALVEKYGAAHMARIGRKGSQALVKKYGLRYYSQIAAQNRGVPKRRRKQDQTNG